MFERFTNRARHVVVLAQEEARGLKHNYIGTEHILLGLLGEPEGLASRALTGLGMSLEGTRQEVMDLVGAGKKEPRGHIPFTPRAKKTLEFGLRESLQLHHTYIGTEHVLLGLLKEGEADGDDGAAIKILKRHAELPVIRTAVIDQLSVGDFRAVRLRSWLRRHQEGGPAAPGAGEQAVLSATPAADVTLSEAARLAGAQPVGSHHLLLASLADPGTAAARALTSLGVDLDQAREALRGMDVTGTSDELPEEAGRRQMLIRLTGDRLLLEAADPAIVEAGRAALAALTALGSKTAADGAIRGDSLAGASLSTVWQALFDSLGVIERRATLAAAAADGPPAGSAGGPPAGSAGGPDAPESGAVA
jgi:Clp amino terminal domain, pathogenicity island component